MDQPISSRLKFTFLLHALVSAVLGAALWLVPGRALTVLGWVDEFVMLPDSNLSIPGQTFVDPLVSRLLGAALLALAFSSLFGWLAKNWTQVALLVQTEAVFCLLGVLAILAVAVTGEREMRLIAWLDLGLLALFGAAWTLAWMKRG